MNKMKIEYLWYRSVIILRRIDFHLVHNSLNWSQSLDLIVDLQFSLIILSRNDCLLSLWMILVRKKSLEKFKIIHWILDFSFILSNHVNDASNLVNCYSKIVKQNDKWPTEIIKLLIRFLYWSSHLKKKLCPIVSVSIC